MNMAVMFEKVAQLPQRVQKEFLKQWKIATTNQTVSAGSVLVAMYTLEFLGVPAYIDRLFNATPTPLKELCQAYRSSRRHNGAIPMPSPGIIISLLIADMVACPKDLVRFYRLQELAKRWKTGSLLGIAPHLLNDDRLLRLLSALGKDPKAIQDMVQMIAVDVSRRFEIPMQRFFLDTTVLQLDGDFAEAEKVQPGRGQETFHQLVVGLTTAAGSRIPINFSVNAGNTHDASTLPDAIAAIDRVASTGPVEIFMDRIFPTPENVLHMQSQERTVYWCSPLKTGLAKKTFRSLVRRIWDENGFFPIPYRSSKEKNGPPQLQAYETEWTLKEEIKPPIPEGATRRPRNSIKKIEIPARCVIYRHEAKAMQEEERRQIQRDELEKDLRKLTEKLNKRNLQTLEACEKKLKQLLSVYPLAKPFIQAEVSTNIHGAVVLSWTWNEEAYAEEVMYDGIFALLTNFPVNLMSANALVKGYRERNEVEVDFKDLRGLLELERMFVRLPERIEAYIALKVLGYLVLAFLRWWAQQAKAFKLTEKGIQEALGALGLTENVIEPLGLPIYSLANDNQFAQWVRQVFELPDPIEAIQFLNDESEAMITEALQRWQHQWESDNPTLPDPSLRE